MVQFVCASCQSRCQEKCEEFEISSIHVEMYLFFEQYVITFCTLVSSYKCGYFNNLFIIFTYI